jgi:predicted CxxxxCH...CXXCH cytochrome family protein
MGNHRTHLSEGSTFNSCVTCHNNDSYTTSHLDGKIQLSMKINNYSGAFGKANYNSTRITTSASGMVFFNQTSVPVLATCSNVNCHFEATTPTWGSGEVSCRVCHGAPPAGISPAYSGGAAGSHGRHDSYYIGTVNCIKCHNDHAGESQPYAHATSAGRRALSLSLRDPQNNPSGTYSNPAVIDYMPSQAAGHLFGNCSTTYCHSPGNRSTAVLPSNKPAAWGGTLGCDGCHRLIPATGSHSKHVETDYGVPVPCYKCHAATVNSANTISFTAQHVNMKVDVSFDGTDTAIMGTYSSRLTPMQKIPGSGYAQCGNVYCHSSGQGNGGSLPPTYSAPKWGDSATGKCGSCHDHGLHNSGPVLHSGSHSKHLDYDFGTGGGGPNLCGVCHYGSGFASADCTQCHFGSDALTTKHVNNKVDVDFVSRFGGTYNGTPQPGDGYSNCSNSYCHSNGTSVSTSVIPANTSSTWGTPVTPACKGCHEYPPSYLNGSPKSNSHASHIDYGCGTCHAGTTTDGETIGSYVKHVNKIFDLQPGAGVSFVYSFAVGGGTCSNISCHFYNSATWGAVLKCGDCHTTSPGDQ